ncbi:MAG: hypothetical protein IH969_01295 [Candidatus Krumholzibacteriota bacterium]|nr:hypothetical protein [Candidatus Krumholzibacteriota bacterium]
MFRTVTVTSALLVIGLVMLMSVNARAQGVGAIMLHSDALATSCNITQNPSGLVTVYVFHSFHNGVIASQFKIEDNGADFVWIADELQQSGTLNIGTTNVGGTFAYGECITTNFNFVNVLYDAQGTADFCSSLEIVPAPGAITGTIDAVDCSLPFPVVSVAGGSTLTVNCPDEGQCGGVVPVESTTWGRVKALYE